MRGRLIAFEGIDGCGKSTQARMLVERIGEPLALLSAEPGATALGARLRELILDPGAPPVSADAEVLLLAADRAEHVAEVLKPAVERGRWVVTDRYSASTLAYQGYGRGIDLGELERIIDFATGGLRQDVNVLVDVPLEVARERIAATRPDRLERLDESFHERVVAGYRKLAAARPDNWVVVDGTRSVHDVAGLVHRALSERVGPFPSDATTHSSPTVLS